MRRYMLFALFLILIVITGCSNKGTGNIQQTSSKSNDHHGAADISITSDNKDLQNNNYDSKAEKKNNKNKIAQRDREPVVELCKGTNVSDKCLKETLNRIKEIRPDLPLNVMSNDEIVQNLDGLLKNRLHMDNAHRRIFYRFLSQWIFVHHLDDESKVLPGQNDSVFTNGNSHDGNDDPSPHQNTNPYNNRGFNQEKNPEGQEEIDFGELADKFIKEHQKDSKNKDNKSDEYFEPIEEWRNQKGFDDDHDMGNDGTWNSNFDEPDNGIDNNEYRNSDNGWIDGDLDDDGVLDDYDTDKDNDGNLDADKGGTDHDLDNDGTWDANLGGTDHDLDNDGLWEPGEPGEDQFSDNNGVLSEMDNDIDNDGFIDADKGGTDQDLDNDGYWDSNLGGTDHDIDNDGEWDADKGGVDSYFDNGGSEESNLDADHNKDGDGYWDADKGGTDHDLDNDGYWDSNLGGTDHDIDNDGYWDADKEGTDHDLDNDGYWDSNLGGTDHDTDNDGYWDANKGGTDHDLDNDGYWDSNLGGTDDDTDNDGYWDY